MESTTCPVPKNKYMIVDSTIKFNPFSIKDTNLNYNEHDIKHYVQRIYDDLINKLHIHSLNCPHCDESKLILWGTYPRSIYVQSGDKAPFLYVKVTLVIQRVYCKHCCRTHSIHPFIMIGYCPYTLDDVFTILTTKPNDIESLHEYGLEDLSIGYFKKLHSSFNRWLEHNHLTRSILDQPVSKLIDILLSSTRLFETKNIMSYLLQPI